MVRCSECEVRQYAATPYVTPAECVACGRPLRLLQSRRLAAGEQRALAAREVEVPASRGETRS
jgi:hypothetical protein